MKEDKNIFDKLANKWWFFLILIIIFFIPSFSTKPIVNPQEISLLIIEVLKNSLILNFPVIFPFIKIIMILFIIGIIIFKNKISRLFILFLALLFLIVAIFQNMAFTVSYGFSILTGNIIIQIISSLFLFYEFIINKNDFAYNKQFIWKYWVIPFALFAFWMPMDKNAQPDFNFLYLFNNESLLTYCMLTPVVLSIFSISFPNINRAVLRALSYIGFLYGVTNMLTWFVFNNEMWWLGVLHIPLFAISIYTFVLSFIKINHDLTAHNKA